MIKIYLFPFSFLVLTINVIHCQDYKKFSYFPLTVGNKWFFSEGNDDIIKLKLEIEKDTILDDGNSYSKLYLHSVWFDPSSSSYWQEIFYWRKVNNTIVEYPDRTIMDYEMSIGDTVWSSYAEHPSVLDNIITENVFSRDLSTYYFYFTPFDLYSFTDSIGFNTLHATNWHNWVPQYLLGCEIDGKVYGKVITGIERHYELTTNYKLYQNYPNPFNPITKIKYSVSKAGFISLIIYDMLGKAIKTLVNDQKSIGDYEVIFDGRNLPSGVYFYKMICGSFSDTKKFILLK